MIKYVAYARYSSDLQSPDSIEDQKRKCREYAQQEGWVEIRTYEDAAVSGSGMDRRGFQRLMADSASAARDFEVILIDVTSRLSRSLADVVTLHQRLAHYGVRVIAVSQGIDTKHEQSELLIAMHGITDSLYVKELGKKTHRGLEGKFLKGLSAGGRCYGYTAVHVEGGGVRWAVNEAEADVVREIFEWSAVGYSLKKIAGLLNGRKTPPIQKRSDRADGTWCPTAIRAMLRRELYIGRRVWNQTKFVKTPGTNKRVARPRLRSEWQVQDVPELRIVSDDLWSRVEKRQTRLKEVYAESGRKPVNRGASSPYLLSGLNDCGACAKLIIVSGGGRGAGMGAIGISLADIASISALRFSIKRQYLWIAARSRPQRDRVSTVRSRRKGSNLFMSIHCRKLIYSAAALFIFSFLVIALPCGMAEQIVKPIQSHEVHSDGTITFRYLDTGAKHVEVSVGGLKAPVPMTNTGGVWTATTPQLPPEIYWYYFIVDGQPQMDPLNGVVLPNYVYLNNVVVVPGATPQLWEATDVPHGELHHHFYKSRYINEAPGERHEDYRYSAPNHSTGYRDYYVYTPPGYDPKNSHRYPILYLLHGYAQTAADWTVPGGANFILDNLIAENKTKPMILVMPVCYGWAIDNCSDAILNEILPQVESEYRVLNDRNHRAIAGLSLGAMESLYIAFDHPEVFAWVGSFSAGDINNLPHPLPMDSTRISFRQLWISCGVNDALLPKNQQLIADLRGKGFSLTAVETPGTHDWTAWHYSLIHFVQLLFSEH